MKNIEQVISLCLIGNKTSQVKEYGIKYCKIQAEHPCPYRENIRFNKLKGIEPTYFYLCKKHD